MKTPTRRQRILVAMSGGVDSSVAAALLVQQGYDVVGATMKTFCYSDDDAPRASSKTCCGLDGIADARRVSDTLGIPHYVFDVEEEFKRDVIDDFVSEYARGRTPNPCVRCNPNTKFKEQREGGGHLGWCGGGRGRWGRPRSPTGKLGHPVTGGQGFSVCWGRPPGKGRPGRKARGGRKPSSPSAGSGW